MKTTMFRTENKAEAIEVANALRAAGVACKTLRHCIGVQTSGKAAAYRVNTSYTVEAN
jgi:hypothetical protein